MENQNHTDNEKATIVWSSDPIGSLGTTIHQEKNQGNPFIVKAQSNKLFKNELDKVTNKQDGGLSMIYQESSYINSYSKSFIPQPYFFMNHTTEQIVLLLHATKEFITFINDLFSKFEYQYVIKPIQFSNLSFTEEEWNDFSTHFKATFGKCFPYSKKLSELSTDENEIQSYISMISSYTHAYNKRYRMAQSLIQKLSDGKKIADDSSSLNHTVLSNTKCSNVMSSNPSLLEGISDSYYYLSNDWKEEANKNGVHICILYDEAQMMTFVIRGESCNWVPSLINEFSGFAVVKEYTSMIESVATSFYDYFNLRSVLDFDDAKKKVESYEILNDIDYSKNGDRMEKDIYTYLLSNYSISGDIKKTMKSCVLQDRIETALLSTPLGNTPIIQEAVADTLKFRKTMSAILLSMGLKKKRMKDGIYYYGIEPKDTHEKIMTTELDVLMRVRDLQSKTGMKKDPSAFQISGIGLHSADTCLKPFSTPLPPPLKIDPTPP